MTYFQQLKDKYPDDVKKAYREYTLSKTLLRTSYHQEDSPEFVLKAMDLQSKFNEYAKNVIEDNNISLIDTLGITRNDISSFFEEHSDALEFLEIDRGNFISHISGMYEMQLNNSFPKGMTFDDLEAVMIAENNNLPILEEGQAKEKLKTIATQFGLNSITYGKVRVSEQALNKLHNSCLQLKEVVECNDNQIGLRKTSLFLDVSEFNYAGQACQYNGEIQLILNERISHDAFAHEWLHGIDMLMAKAKKSNTYMYSDVTSGSVHKLLESLKVKHDDDINEIKSKVLEDTKTHITKTIDRFETLASVSDSEILKNKIYAQIDLVCNKKYDKEAIVSIVKPHMKDKNGLSSFVLTELNMLDSFLKEKTFEHSYFYTYAKEMQTSLEKTKLMDYEYSTARDEMFARSFESYANFKLEEKNLDNNIAQSTISGWTPKKVETIRIKTQWENVMKEVMDVMNFYLPSQSNVTKLDSKKVKNNILALRENKPANDIEMSLAAKIK